MGGGAVLLCQPPPPTLYIHTQTQNNQLPASVLWSCLSAALLGRSWLNGDVERKVCLYILPVLGQRAPTH